MEKKEIPTYYIKNGFRFVEDYEYCFKTHAKIRWKDKEIFEVFSKEFLAYTPEYYVKNKQ